MSEEAGVAATAARPLTATALADVDDARSVVARKVCTLLDLLQRFPDLFKKEVLERLDPTDRTMLAQVGWPWLAAVLASGLPRLPRGSRRRLRLREFCTSAERLAWARANGCPWGNVFSWFGSHNPSALAAAGGHLEALQWAWEHDCPWDDWTCTRAAEGGHQEVLRWAREHDCPWDEWTCAYAAAGGHLATLQWVRAHGCPWCTQTMRDISRPHPETEAWIWAQPE